MPQKIKYVGPKDEKTFRDFVFFRDVSDDASAGRNAVEVPDDVANAALKHRTVFMQWDKPVPEKVKAQRHQLPDALEAEGRRHHEHFARRKIVAEVLITPDSEAKAEQLAKEIAGAEAEMEHGLRRIAEAAELRSRIREEQGLAPLGGTLPATSDNDTVQQLLSIVRSLQEEVARLKAGQPPVDQKLAGELATLQETMQQQLDEGEEPEENAPGDLGELNVPAKLKKALREGGLTTIEELAAESPATLVTIKGVGEVAVNLIAAALAERGLKLAEPEGAPGVALDKA